MLAGILITLGVGTFAYQGIASKSQKSAVEARLTRVTIDHVDGARPIPFVGTILLLGGMALLLVERTRPLPLFERRPRPR